MSVQHCVLDLAPALCLGLGLAVLGVQGCRLSVSAALEVAAIVGLTSVCFCLHTALCEPSVALRSVPWVVHQMGSLRDGKSAC